MKNKFLLILCFTFLAIVKSNAQNSTPFVVGGDIDKFYPVIFTDANWMNNRPTQLEIGRSSIHQDEGWRGSLISRFLFHTTTWGNGARFTDADIKQTNNGNNNIPFIAGYKDATINNGSFDFIVWLKGGGTTYYFTSNVTQNPRIYDGVQNALPYQEINGPAHTFKTSIDTYVNSSGKSNEGTIYSLGNGLNYLNGDLGLGTLDTRGFKLAVNGNIRAKEIKVEAINWPDYVFEDSYKVGKLEELESYIKMNKHLPEMPTAKEVATNGLAVSQMLKLQQKKIEELTLYLIEKDKNISDQGKLLKSQAALLVAFEERLKKLEASVTHIKN